jgi:hypothetical protein
VSKSAAVPVVEQGGAFFGQAGDGIEPAAVGESLQDGLIAGLYMDRFAVQEELAFGE